MSQGFVDVSATFRRCQTFDKVIPAAKEKYKSSELPYLEPKG